MKDGGVYQCRAPAKSIISKVFLQDPVMPKGQNHKDKGGGKRAEM